MTALHDLAAEHLDAVLALNAAHVAETSELTLGELEYLVATAFSARGTGGGEAFLLTFDETADYASPNYLWFRARYPRFVYVDRVIVAPQARGRGLARRLYEDLFARTGASGRELVACEVNLQPPNPGSDAFHASLGFTEVGRAEIHQGAKTVRYLVRKLG
ncbi:MAG: GNAT family N-acetyltransferase [Rhodovibrionaceae bacterium]